MPGSEITINGYCFGNEAGSSIVAFNDIIASEIISWSATQIIVKVPAGAVSGKLAVTIDGNKSNEVDYKIVDLYIESISPSSAYVGDEITISGFGFGSTRGTSVVSFKSKDASEYTSWSDSEIKVKVPKGAKTGKVYVTVKGQLSNEVDFTVSTNSGGYEEVTIGDQVWMLKNLDVTRYRNGDEITEVTDQTVWEPLTTGAWCYNDNDEANGEIYGKIYNGYAVSDSRGLAPEGWHIPSDDELKTLEIFLGMSQAQADGEGYRGTNEGGKLKEDGYYHWNSPNTDATNESGFTLLPGGMRDTQGDPGFPPFLNKFGYIWSSTSSGANGLYARRMGYNSGQIQRYGEGKKRGLSVRCIKD
jgi:uncharacterized protein (TIGR02145 family)